MKKTNGRLVLLTVIMGLAGCLCYQVGYLRASQEAVDLMVQGVSKGPVLNDVESVVATEAPVAAIPDAK